MTDKSERIERLLNDQDLNNAFETVREYYRDKIEECPMSLDNPEPLMDIRKMLHLLGDVKQALYTAIQDGHLEDFNAQEKERVNAH